MRGMGVWCGQALRFQEWLEWKEVRKVAVWGRPILAEGTARAKVLRWECTWHVQETERRPAWLEQGELQGQTGEGSDRRTRGHIIWGFFGLFQVSVPQTSYPISLGRWVCVRVRACVGARVHVCKFLPFLVRYITLLSCSHLKAVGVKQNSPTIQSYPSSSTFPLC